MLVTIGDVDYFKDAWISDFGIPISQFTDLISTYTGLISSYGTLISELNAKITELADIHDNKVRNNTMNIQKNIQSSHTADFTLIDIHDGYQFQKGQPIIIRHPETYQVESRGFVDNETVSHEGNSGLVWHQLACVGTTYITDKRLIRKGFVNYTVAQMVRWIYQKYLRSEGIKIGKIQSTQDIIPKKTFDLSSLTDAFNDLAVMVGYTWKIDGDMRLFFQPSIDIPAPWQIDLAALQTDILWGVTAQRGGTSFRDVQYMRGGKAETEEISQTFTGDNVRSSWTVRFPIKSVSAVYVNGTPKSVGLSGQTGNDFSYSENSTTFSQDYSGSRLTDTDILEIIYIGYYDLLLKIVNNQAVVDRSNIDLGSGRVETVIDAPEFTTEESLLAYGRALLEQYAKETITVNYRTKRTGILEGQSQHISHPILNIDDDFLISNVNVVNEDDQIFYFVTATNGMPEEIWQKVFGPKPIAKDTIASNVIICEDIEVFWRLKQSPNPFTGVAAVMFRYLEINSSNDTFRAAIADIDIQADQIMVTAQIPMEGSNGQISSVSLWGASWATEEVGSGIRYWQGDIDLEKSELEILNFTIIHLKKGNWTPPTPPPWIEEGGWVISPGTEGGWIEGEEDLDGGWE